MNYANKIIDFLGILESVLQFDIRGMAVESGCRAEGVEHIMPFDGDIPSLFDQFAEDHKVEQKEYDHGEQIIDNGMIVLVSQNPDPKHIDPCNQPYGFSDNQQVFL